MIESDREKLARASQAEHAKDYVDQILLEKKDKIIAHLCMMYREGKLDFPVICGKLGELTLIEDATSKVDREIKQGRQIEKRLYDAT